MLVLRRELSGIALTFENGSIVAIIVALSEQAGGFHDRIHGDEADYGEGCEICVVGSCC